MTATATRTPYHAPLPKADPDCGLCHGSGIDPDFQTTCIECLKPTRSTWLGARTAPAPTARPVDGPTEKQVAFYGRLVTERIADAAAQADAVARFAGLSKRQASQAIDTILAAPKVPATPAAPAADATPAPVAGLDLRQVPSGRYGVPGGDTRLKVQIDVITEGKWAGWVFVKDAAEYGQGRRYGSARPGQNYRGDIEAELAAIAADPKAAAARYGALTGRCGICNRTLEDADSVARGIGPVCAAKAGW